MSRRAEKGSLFVGRLSKDIRSRDLDEVFEKYGPVDRCDIKYGAEMAYAFVDFADRLDAEDVLKYENGRDILGSEIVIEWAKGNPRRTMGRFNRGSVGGFKQGSDECFRCHRRGHWAKECHSRGPPRGGRWRRSRSRDRYRRRGRSNSRSRSRSRSRDKKRSRRDSHRDRKRSRSRSRSPRSASRSRSKSRNRSRSKSPRRSRSKSRNRTRSKSRGNSRSKSRERSRSRSVKRDRSPEASPKNDDKGATNDNDD